MASRVLWKGAISFGLVHIPVALHTATRESGVDFDWLDQRTLDPVGYKRINKRTGKEVDSAHIVKGVQYEDGQYVVLSAEEIAAAYPRTTQTIEIQEFVDAPDIPFTLLERPYYVAPINKGQKVYALLREALKKSGKIGIAKVVIQTKQHLAALVPSGAALVLNLLRWNEDIKPLDELELPAATAKGAGLNDKELKMALALVEDMGGAWDPDAYRDEFKDAIMALVEKKAKAGEAKTVTQPEEDAPSGGSGSGSAQIYDLSALLQQSLRAGAAGKPRKPAPKAGARTAAPKAAARPAAKKKAAKTAATGTAARKAPLRKAA